MKTPKIKTPIWYWFISIPLLILGIMGILQINSVWSTEMTEPLWAKLSYSLGISGMFLGSVFLIFRKKLATILFLASILGFILHRTWVFGFSELSSEAPLTLFLPILINLIAVLLAYYGVKKGWIV